MNAYYLQPSLQDLNDFGPVERPDCLCVFCWPKLIFATHWDEQGNACCNRPHSGDVCRMPRVLS